jgi:hypothetical protein
VLDVGFIQNVLRSPSAIVLLSSAHWMMIVCGYEFVSVVIFSSSLTSCLFLCGTRNVS